MLKEENTVLKQNHDDLIDELETKNNEVKDLMTQVSNSSLKSSSSSLSDELQQVKMLSCKHCSLNFASEAELNDHEKELLEETSTFRMLLMEKVSKLERKVSEQKINCAASIFELQRQEIEESHSCHCKTFCRIIHKKHNFVKSKSEHFLSELKRFSEIEIVSDQIQSDLEGFITNKYTCNKCGKNFSKQGVLKKHIKDEHKAREEEIGEVQESVRSGEVSE